MPTRISHALLAALAAVLVLPVAAQAAPTVSLHATAAAIPRNPDQPHGATWPHTGNRVGSAAELEATATIHGSEDAGLPNPLRQIVVWLPNGIKLNKHGFGTCRLPHGSWFLTGHHPSCPADSLAGSLTTEQLNVKMGGIGILPAPIARQLFFPPGGGLSFWELIVADWIGAEGAARVHLKHTGNHHAAYGYTLSATFPRMQVMETGPDLSPEAFTLAIGAATQSGGRLHSYLTLPDRCPAGGWPLRETLSFGQGAQGTWEPVTASTRLHCRPGRR